MKNGQLALDDLATLQRRGQPTTPVLVIAQGGGRLINCTDLNDLARRIVELTPQGAVLTPTTWSWPDLDSVHGFTVRSGQDIVASCSTLGRPVAELEAAIAAARGRA